MTSQANITDYFNSRKRGGSTTIKSRAKVLVLEAEKCLKVAAQETSVTKRRFVFQESVAVEKSETPRTPVIKKSSIKLGNESLKQSLLTKFTTKVQPTVDTGVTTVEHESSPRCADKISDLPGTASRDQAAPNVSDTLHSMCGPGTSGLSSPSRESPHVGHAGPSGLSSPSRESPHVGHAGPSGLSSPSRESPHVGQAGPAGPSSPLRASPHVGCVGPAGLSSPLRASPHVGRRETPVKKLGTPRRALMFGDSPVKRIAKSTKKDVSLAEIRDRLKSGGQKTEELKARLSRFAKLSKEEESIKLDHFASIEVDVPRSPCKAPYASPVKSSAAAEGGLPLPWRYRGLYDKFKAVDLVANMMVNRAETCTFAKLQPAVQEMTRLDLSERHLGQIACVLPSAFAFSQQRSAGFALTGRADQYDLVLAPSYETCDCDERGKAGPSALQRRHRQFYKTLLTRVMDFHQEYLSHLEPPLEIPKDKLTRWHPGFDPERIPDVEEAPLPRPPHQDKVTSAREVLERARDMLDCNPRVQEALARVAERHHRDSEVTQHSDTVNPALRGIPSSLLEKIRARQAARAVEAMTRSAAEDLEQSKLARLPELARITRNIFVTDKKSVLPRDVLLAKLANCYPHTTTSGELAELLDLLVVEAPSLLQRLYMRQTTFLKVNKDVKMSDIASQLEQRRSRH